MNALKTIRTLLVITSLVALPLRSTIASDLCPPFSKAQWIITRISKGTLSVKSLKPVKDFNACEITTTGGETFFLSKDGKKLLEGVLLKVPELKVSKKDYRVLKSNVLFFAGRGKELVLVATNPLCEACRSHRKELKKLLTKYKIGFIPVGFNRREEIAAIDAFCRRKNLRNFFNLPRKWRVCDSGKLKVWTVEDVLKKYGVTGTPVFILPDGKVRLGLEAFLRR